MSFVLVISCSCLSGRAFTNTGCLSDKPTSYVGDFVMFCPRTSITSFGATQTTLFIFVTVLVFSRSSGAACVSRLMLLYIFFISASANPYPHFVIMSKQSVSDRDASNSEPNIPLRLPVPLNKPTTTKSNVSARFDSK